MARKETRARPPTRSAGRTAPPRGAADPAEGRPSRTELESYSPWASWRGALPNVSVQALLKLVGPCHLLRA